MPQSFTPSPVRIDRASRSIVIEHAPGKAGALFDICDPQGHVLKSGLVLGPNTRVRLDDVRGDELLLLVLDGDVGTVRSIHFGA